MKLKKTLKIINKMPDYKKGKIYCIKTKLNKDVYIGSTVQKLNNRLRGHRYDYKKFLNGKCNYMSSFKLIEAGDCYIELIAECSCENRKQLLKVEGKYIREMDCVNMLNTIRTKAEEVAQKRKHYDANKPEILVRNKKRYEDNKDEILGKQKTRYEENKETILKRHKLYANKLSTCECGLIGKVGSLKRDRHRNTKTHTNWVKELDEDKKKLIWIKNNTKTKPKSTSGSFKLKCECGVMCRRDAMSKHKKRKVHFDNLNKL